MRSLGMPTPEDKIIGCPNFRWGEFVGWESLPDERVQGLVINLARIAQAGRWIFDPVKFIVTSAIRNLTKMTELKRRGYVVAKKTDHAYLDPFVYQFGVGAMDFTVKPEDISILPKIFQYFVTQGRLGTLDFGQVIWYPPHKHSYRSMNSIHLSNPRSLVYSEKFIGWLPPKRKYLTYDPESGKFKVWHEVASG